MRDRQTDTHPHADKMDGQTKDEELICVRQFIEAEQQTSLS